MPSDLTNLDLIHEKTLSWRHEVEEKTGDLEMCPHLFLTCDDLAFEPILELTDQEIIGLDTRNIDFDESFR
jgi:hypothetical protein